MQRKDNKIKLDRVRKTVGEEHAMGKCFRIISEDVALPVFDLIRRTSRFKFGRVLRKTQWLSQEEICRLQKRNLQVLLRHAYDSVPYYRRIFKERGLSPVDIKSRDDLCKLPILTKSDVRKNFEDLTSRRFIKRNLVPCRTGGTGNPLKFYITKDQLSWEVAAEYRAYSWANYQLGDRCFTLWGSPIDLAKYRKAVNRLVTKLERVKIADTYLLSNQVLDKLVFSLRKFHPEIIRGYAASAFLMAKYLIDNGVDYIRPRAVITAAETLTNSDRKTIEQAFDCPVFDYYGSREIGAIAAECEKHSGYHISAENVVMEFVRNGEYVASGEKGLVVVTNLRNLGMPLIRYEIGDIGTPTYEICNCGRGLPLMKSIEGRLYDFMAVYDEKLKHIVPMGPLHPTINSIMRLVPLQTFRIEQVSLDKFVIKAVKDRGFSENHTDFIISCLHSSLGERVRIELEFVDCLRPLPSGKRSPFVSRLNPFEQ